MAWLQLPVSRHCRTKILTNIRSSHIAISQATVRAPPIYIHENISDDVIYDLPTRKRVSAASMPCTCKYQPPLHDMGVLFPPHTNSNAPQNSHEYQICEGSH